MIEIKAESFELGKITAKQSYYMNQHAKRLLKRQGRESFQDNPIIDEYNKNETIKRLADEMIKDIEKQKEHGTNYDIKNVLHTNCFHCKEDKNSYILILIDKVRETFIQYNNSYLAVLIDEIYGTNTKSKMPVFLCQECLDNNKNMYLLGIF